MSRNVLQTFAAGIFMAAAILSVYHFFFEPEKQKTSKPKVSAVYTQPAKKEEASIKNTPPIKEKQEVQNSADSAKSAPLSYTLEVKQGMTSGQIADLLQQKGILKDKNELVTYMDKHHLNEKIQLGTYVLTSSMTLAQIGSTLAKDS
ncbi:endolytic transglycosylase MltG [Peribacillus kribbensis]|uniref:endolytic transglycosylase MltG n=1 Tax=Peribacillus kribbensis TaxID=356658 RepID=UPI000429C085|nr:endolytic transglycosylase MltG [Peribacillus kribbensis]